MHNSESTILHPELPEERKKIYTHRIHIEIYPPYIKSMFSKVTTLTLSDATKRTAPIGINTTPITKNRGNAVEAVRIGCHALNLCCLKLESEV